LNADPDPATQFNADPVPDPQPWWPLLIHYSELAPHFPPLYFLSGFSKLLEKEEKEQEEKQAAKRLVAEQRRLARYIS
jgi:hypothetical protein